MRRPRGRRLLRLMRPQRPASAHLHVGPRALVAGRAHAEARVGLRLRFEQFEQSVALRGEHKERQQARSHNHGVVAVCRARVESKFGMLVREEAK